MFSSRTLATATDNTNELDIGTVHVLALADELIRYLQGAPIKNNPLEKMLYFSHGSIDLS